MAPPPPRRYHILDLLGEGGLARVYRARTTGIDGTSQVVALKLIREGVPREAEMLARLRDEARILARISHPCVVGVHGLAHLDRGWAVALEFVDGVDCARLLQHTAVPVPICLEILEQVADVLHAAWHQPKQNGEALNAMHRDIKPHNICVDRQGRVKVLDFGAARASFSEREAYTQSMLFGTPRYLAPERVEGKELPAADVYSLGVTAYELLRRESLRPSEMTGEGAVGQRAAAELATWLDTEHSDLPEVIRLGICGLLDEMMRLLPAERPTAAEVRDRCRRLRADLGDTTLEKWAPNTVGTYLDASRGEPQRDDLYGTISTELPDQKSELIPHAELAVPRPRASRRWMVVGAIALASAVAAGGLALQWSQPGASDGPSARQPVPPPAPDPAPGDGGPLLQASPAPDPPTRAVRFEEDTPLEVVFVGDEGDRYRLPTNGEPPPPGRYQLMARFDEYSRLAAAGSVTVPEEGDTVLVCSARLNQCRP